ncbi:MAG: DUF2232 domain-containing protein [Spirulina sp. SIO3F2]|nr:DUF2232 domain-containing protein [Spirulina sp. SIO3F2]
MTPSPWENEVNWVDAGDDPRPSPTPPQLHPPQQRHQIPLVMVETAFLASAASLIWLINYYFPLGPILRIFFPIPIALLYLRRGDRAAWMGTIVSGLLLSVLMGPTRSVLYVMPYALMGVQLGALWRRGYNWTVSMLMGSLLGTMGSFFFFGLVSFLLGQNLWRYTINQVTVWVNWLVLRLGLLAQPERIWIELAAIALIMLNSVLYLFTVHLVALVMFDRLKTPIPRPPEWVQVLFEYDY